MEPIAKRNRVQLTREGAVSKVAYPHGPPPCQAMLPTFAGQCARDLSPRHQGKASGKNNHVKISGLGAVTSQHSSGVKSQISPDRLRISVRPFLGCTPLFKPSRMVYRFVCWLKGVGPEFSWNPRARVETGPDLHKVLTACSPGPPGWPCLVDTHPLHLGGPTYLMACHPVECLHEIQALIQLNPTEFNWPVLAKLPRHVSQPPGT